MKDSNKKIDVSESILKAYWIGMYVFKILTNGNCLRFIRNSFGWNLATDRLAAVGIGTTVPQPTQGGREMPCPDSNDNLQWSDWGGGSGIWLPLPDIPAI